MPPGPVEGLYSVPASPRASVSCVNLTSSAGMADRPSAAGSRISSVPSRRTSDSESSWPFSTAANSRVRLLTVMLAVIRPRKLPSAALTRRARKIDSWPVTRFFTGAEITSGVRGWSRSRV